MRMGMGLKRIGTKKMGLKLRMWLLPLVESMLLVLQGPSHLL
jgi:hypothetical protein